MNQRIEKLAEQAGFHFDEYNEPTARKTELFAELIVRECCEVIIAAKPGVVQVPAEVALDMTSKNVKEYFGVES